MFTTSQKCAKIHLQLIAPKLKDISSFGGFTMNCKRKIDKAATGLKLYRLIKESGFTYAEIAEYLELQTPRVIYDWINGNKLPSTENLYNLAELFNVQIEDILAF